MPRDRVLAFLASDDGVVEVQALMASAAEHEITAVPTYVISRADDHRSWMVPGAQDTEVFVRVLRRLADA